MATVTVTANLKSVGGVPDNTVFSFRSPTPRLGADGSIVTAKWTRVAPVNGILTAELEPGPCVVSWTGSNPLSIEIPETDSDLWGLIAVAIGVPPGTPQGTLISAVIDYLSSNASPLGAQLLTATTAPVARVAISAVGKGELVINAADYGAKGDNTTNDTAALQAALNAVPNGGTLYIPPGRYLVRTTLTSTAKSLTINAPGVVLVQDADVDVLRITGTFETIYGVSSLTPTFVTIDATSNVPGLTFTTSGATGWVRGDVVKIVADDEIPGGRPTDTTSKSRLGQFFHVRDVTGTSVTVIGNLHDPFTTNIRAARMTKCTANITGLRIESNNVTDWLGAGLKLYSMYAPQVNMSFGQMPSVVSTLRSCYRPRLTIVADGGNNDPVTGKLSYALLDCGSENGEFNITAGPCRHNYTDGSNVVEPNSTSIRDYGRPYGHVVRGIAHGTANSAWDTHSTAMNITFVDCVAIDCSAAFSLRGRYNQILGGVAEGCGRGFLLQDEPRLGQDSESFGHTIDGLTLRNTPFLIFQANFEDATAPSYGQRVTVPTIVRNVIMDGGFSAASPVTVVNQTVIFENIRIVANPTIGNSLPAFNLTNADVSFRNVELDWRNNTAGTGMKGIETLSDSVVKGSGLRWLFNSGTESRISKVVVGTSGSVWDVTEAEISHNVIPVFGALGASGSRFDYKALSTGHNMAWSGASDSTIASSSFPLSLSSSKAAVVFARCNPTDANRTLAKFQSGAFRGQRLNITNSATSGGYTVTINHGLSPALTDNIGAASVVLANGQSAQWVWDGSYWRQENRVLASPQVTGTESLAAGADLKLFNTADQVTNYEQARSYWSGDVYIIETAAGGTGTLRSATLRLSTNTSSVTVNNAGTRVALNGASGSATGVSVGVTGALTAASGIQKSLSITPTMTQTGTGGYTALAVDVTDTSTGSGTKKLIDAAVGGASKFSVSNTGVVTAVAANTAGTALVRAAVPASATATGVAGQIATDGSFVYVCSATNTWVRAALATW